MEKKELLYDLQQKTVEADLPLKESAANIVFGKGNPEAEIMFIGEAPGDNEDKQGLPFVGSAGKNLDALLRLIGLTIDDVYIANILKYRPPKNRNPSMDEIRSHTPYLVEQIKVISPKVICTLGNFSTKFVLANMMPEKMKNIGGITSLHGNVKSVQIKDKVVKVMPSYHPAAMLYNPNLRPKIEEDFHVLKRIVTDTINQKHL